MWKTVRKVLVGGMAVIGAIYLLVTIGVISLIVHFTTQVEDSTTAVLDHGGPMVLVLNLEERLDESPSPYRLPFSAQTPDMQSILKSLEIASQDPRVVGLVANFSFATLGCAQAQELRDAIKTFQDHGKWTKAYADSFLGGLGAYYAATACQEVIVQPEGELWLMGLNVEVPFVKEVLTKWGIKTNFARRESFKGAPETYTESDFTEPNKQQLQELLTSLTNQFVRDVSKDRKISEARLKEAMDASPLLIAEGKNYKLIDRLEFYEKVREEIVKESKATFTTLNSYLRYKEKKHASEAPNDAPKIALIYGSGEIDRDPPSREGLFAAEGIMGSNATAKAFRDAMNAGVKAIVFRVNTPGGSSIASEAIWGAVRQAQSKGIPVVISMSDMAASGGYLISTHANKIVAQPGTITGSIGVYAGKFITKGLWDIIGVNWGSVKVGKNAGIWSSNQEFTPDQWTKFNAHMDATYHSFLSKVSEGRHMTLDQARSVAQGRVWTGEQALKNGLVDALGGMSKAIEFAKTEAKIGKDAPVSLVTFPRRLTFSEALMELLEGDGRALSQGMEYMIWSTSVGRLFGGALLEFKEAMEPQSQAMRASIDPVR